jgi:histidinol-phosphatase
MPDRRLELTSAQIVDFQRHALTLADRARSLIQEALRTGFEVKLKSDHSYVTSADVAVEKELRALVAQRYPDHGVLGEEFPPTLPDAPFQWIFDPIDGTEDFVHRVPTYGSILALYYEDLPVVGVVDHPSLDIRCEAAFGQGARHNGKPVRLMDLAADITDARLRLIISARANFLRFYNEAHHFDALTAAFPNHRTYRSCLGHSLVAIGAADVMVDYHDTLWDLAAARILVEEAGGAYRTTGEFVTDDRTRVYSSVFGRPAAVARVCSLLESI